MKNSSRPPVIRIKGDHIENDRIQLEHNLQNTELSIRLSSQDGFDDSIEYPRHNSGPSPFNDFGSFIHRSGDHFDGDIHNAWSYRTGDDDEGVHPYGGETMSTAAHHASALTLTAGLGGNRGVRRDVSLSGAEYDPDRPLHAMIAGVDSKLSIFDADPSRSKYTAPGGITFDPLVVDSTAELDRILESGHAPPPSLRCRIDVARSNNSSSTSSSSDSEGPNSRPKITDALRRVSFSPKRPRSPRTYHSPHHRSSNLPNVQPTPSILLHTSSPLSRQPHPQTTDGNIQSTPKPRHAKRDNVLPSHSPQPEVRLQPPTPSSSTSRLAKQTRILSKGVDAGAERSRISNKGDARNIERRDDMPEGPGIPSSMTHLNTSRGHLSKSRVQLPDITGLTSVVDSPARGMLNHYPYQASDEPRESEARLLAVLNTIQQKLTHLEDENSISRRRVRELEYELEVCKREVAKERTRVVEKESAILQNQRELERAVADAKKTLKGKGKARNASVNHDADVSVRYKEAVEEKKALETLISTLRSHLTRLTAELSSHQELLVELRSLREADSRALKEKTADIARLRDEVERLAGEVEVLRGVVEEGLKERRLNRENSRTNESQSELISGGQGSQEVSAVDTGTAEEEEEEEEADDEEDGEETEEAEPFDPISIPGSSRDGLPDRTMRTDRATIGVVSANGMSNQSRSGRFIDDDELDRIAADVEERRSELSVDSPSNYTSRILEPSRSVSPHSKRPILEVEQVVDKTDGSRVATPAPDVRNGRRAADRSVHSPPPVESRPAAPTPAHASSHYKRSMRPKDDDYHDVGEEAPFPQIRGERLERLFFDAPDHDEKTCNVCRRTRGNGANHRPTSPSLLPSRLGQGFGQRVAREAEGEDEGFAEEEELEMAGPARMVRRREKQVEGRGRIPPVRDSHEKRKNLPQQTVLTRVIRELEDDFTHFKGVYVELADEYKDMDPVSDVPRRNLLAQHLREVVDVLEQKGDQIASLYDLLTFQDKPIPDTIPTGTSDYRLKGTHSPRRTGGLKNRFALA